MLKSSLIFLTLIIISYQQGVWPYKAVSSYSSANFVVSIEVIFLIYFSIIHIKKSSDYLVIDIPAPNAGLCCKIILLFVTLNIIIIIVINSNPSSSTNITTVTNCAYTFGSPMSTSIRISFLYAPWVLIYTLILIIYILRILT